MKMRPRISDPRITEAAVVSAPDARFVLRKMALLAPRDDEVIVELEACGMCHADLAAQAGSIPFPLPGVLGHEGVGHVVENGSSVRGLRVGQRVVISFTSCGRCPSCLDAAPAYCAEWPVLNLTGGARRDGTTSLCCDGRPVHSHFFGQSSFSRYVAVSARAVVPVPEDLPATVLAPLGCGVQTGVSAVLNVLRPKQGARVAVFGAGAVGLSALMGLRLTAAAQVIAIDVHGHRLHLARELGATDVINARQEDVKGAISRLTGGKGVRGAVETSGNPDSLKAAIQSLSASGTCVVIGVPAHGEPGQFDVMDMVARGLRIVGTNQGDANPRTMIDQLVALYRQGRLPVEKLVTTFPFRDINEAAAASRDGRAVKPVLVMGDQ